MTKTIRSLLTLTLGAALALPSLAGAMDHGSMGGHSMGGGAKAAGAAPRHGKEIREAKAEGYKLEYNLIDMAEMMKGTSMKHTDMSKMKSHHLMVYLAGPDGKAVADAKVGYLIAGPGDAEQKTMAMFMDGGFGADVDLKAKGTYKVKTKAVAGEKTLVDEFTYTVK